tara:strand:- start:5708 stop:6262 length:555 start_codon:yes stop_codon:yes gene_type:complete
VNIVQYRPQIAIIGSRNLSKENLQRVEDISFSLVEEKYRIVTGGLGSLQKYAHKGAKRSSHSGDGDTIAILPGFDPSPAIGHADIIIPTGLDLLRNAIVANSDAVLCVDGGAGTLSEIAFAWQMNRPIISIGGGGWSTELTGVTLDQRFPNSKIIDCSSLTQQEIMDTLNRMLEEKRPRHTGID